jgi:hypothetical protein
MQVLLRGNPVDSKVADSVVTILYSTTTVDTATSDANGFWSLSRPTRAPGTNAPSAEATNAAGLTVLLSSRVTINV